MLEPHGNCGGPKSREFLVRPDDLRPIAATIKLGYAFSDVDCYGRTQAPKGEQGFKNGNANVRCAG